MTTRDLNQRTYDILRLLDAHEPIGSVHLAEHLQERGYSLTERTVRVTLAELDEVGLTEKAGGKGRRLTPDGRAELRRGGVSGRTEYVRERLAELTRRVSYDPAEDAGDLVVGEVTVPEHERETIERLLCRIDDSPLGPVRVAVEETEHDGTDCLRIAAPSSVTVDGILLDASIDADLETAGVVEYHPDPESVPYDDPEPAAHGGAVLRFTDVIGNEEATLDVASLLIGAGHTDLGAALAGRTGLVVADNREFPLAHYAAARELATTMRDRLGGVVDVRRPREPGPFPWDGPGWSFASLTYVGVAECVLSRCVELDVAIDWETLAGTRSIADLSRVSD